jgi:hypothetical protein
LGNRWERLAVEAQLRGILDFRASHRYDERWLLKESLLLAALENELATEMNGRVLNWHCNAAQITEYGDDKLFEFHMLKAEETFNDIGKHYLPWYSQWSNTEGARLVELYQRFKGEEKLPWFREWHDKLKKNMQDDVAAIEQETRQLEEARARRVLFDKAQVSRQSRRRVNGGLR